MDRRKSGSNTVHKDSHKHGNSKDTEAKLGICVILDKREKGWRMGSSISKVKMGSIQVAFLKQVFYLNLFKKESGS